LAEQEDSFQPGCFVVVLTGGIAAGKSAVSDSFARRGVPIVDTDVIARELVQPGQPTLEAIRDAFGETSLDAEGQLDRRKMRETIFSDPSAKQRLESILHPAIMSRAKQLLEAVNTPYCILVVPLLTQSGALAWTRRVLVVDAAEVVQIERVMARDDIDAVQAQAILDAQISRERRLELADDIIDNSESLQDLEAQVDRLHEMYTRLAMQAQE
jgi:dephospho-CoA kinase